MELVKQVLDMTFEWGALTGLIVGTVGGIVIGALPGFSASMGVALLIPITYGMSPVAGLIMLTAVYTSAIYGGSITATLCHTPGTPASAATAIDGYKLTQQGRGMEAVGVCTVASMIGGVVGALALLFLSPPLGKFSLQFSALEYCMLAIFGVTIIASLAGESLYKGLFSGILGLFLGTVGLDAITGTPRFTFGSIQLEDGIQFVPALIGMFSISQVMIIADDVFKGKHTIVDEKSMTGRILPPWSEFKGLIPTIARSSVIGTIIGILPGAGATIASFLCYSTETKLSKYPEKFGTGIIDGIAASESANNAATGGAMVPLLSLGIPGGNAAAVMMSALVLKGVQLGPLLLTNQPQYLSATFASMLVTNILMVIVAMGIAKVFAKILAIPYSYLGPIIVMLAIIGSYATNMSIADVKIMAIAGIAGLIFAVCHFNSAAMILGLVLGEICESNFSRAYTISRADLVSMFSRPIAGSLMALSIALLVYPIVASFFRKKKPSANA